jgi:uncharacterized membrane protein
MASVGERVEMMSEVRFWAVSRHIAAHSLRRRSLRLGLGGLLLGFGFGWVGVVVGWDFMEYRRASMGL